MCTQMSFNVPNTSEQSKIQQKLRDGYGCCNLYRECSDAKKCVSEISPDSALCIYNEHLKNGEIFYGKNANEYNPELYKKVVAIYDSLSPLARENFNYYLDKYLMSVKDTVIEICKLETSEELSFYKCEDFSKFFSNRFETSDELVSCGFMEIADISSIVYFAKIATAGEKRRAKKEGRDIILYQFLLSEKDCRKFYPNWIKIKRSLREYNNAHKQSKRTFREELLAAFRKGDSDFPQSELRNRFNALTFKSEFKRYFIEIYHDFVK